MTWSHLGIDDYHDSSGHKTYRWWKIFLPICLYCLSSTKFVQSILRKLFKIVASRCQVLRLKCTEFDFGWGSTPDPAGGAYSAPQTPYLDLRGLYF